MQGLDSSSFFLVWATDYPINKGKTEQIYLLVIDYASSVIYVGWFGEKWNNWLSSLHLRFSSQKFLLEKILPLYFSGKIGSINWAQKLLGYSSSSVCIQSAECCYEQVKTICSFSINLFWNTTTKLISRQFWTGGHQSHYNY